MELRHLRYFCAVADTLNFSRAAERLRVAQPALSRQIKGLEDEIGVQLLRRSTTQVELTDAGRHFQQQVLKILVQLDLAIGTAQQVDKGDGRRKLCVGTDWLIPHSPITAATRALRKRFPKVSVDFVDLPGPQHLGAIRSKRIDVGFLPAMMVSSRDDLQVKPLYTSSIMVGLPEEHPLASAKEIKLRQLKGERWLSLSEKVFPGFRSLMQQAMRPAMFTPKFGRSTGSFHGMITLVSAGEGLALIPEIFIREQLSGISFVRTDVLPMELCAVWLRSAPAAIMACFFDALASEFAKTPR